MSKLMFNSIDFVKILNHGGVWYPEIHAQALTEALSQNVYSKNEVDQMIDKALEEMRAERRESDRKFRLQSFQFQRNLLRMEKKFSEEMLRHEKEMLKIENRFEKAINRTFKMNVAVFSSIVIIMQTLTTLLSRTNWIH